MLRNKSIVCFANDYKNDPTSKQQVMTILSETNKILWVNSIALRTPTLASADRSRIFNKIKSFFSGIDKVNENFFVFTPLVLPFPTSKIARHVNSILLQLYLVIYTKKLSMKNLQIWTFMPTMVDFAGKLNERFLLYYCVDEWSEFSFIDKDTMKDMEIRLLKKSDLVITTADTLYKEKSKYNNNTHLVRHGVDYDMFSKATMQNTIIPSDLKIIPEPRIGFFGLIHEWIDVNLIKYVAENNPDMNFVFIGKVATDVTSVKNMSNVYFLGQKNYTELAGYCRGFSVATIPFVVNELTINVNPIKLREYLAAGLPVVSTALPEIEPYKDVVFIAKTYDEFSNKLKHAIQQRGDEWIRNRQLSVINETWRAKVEQISKLINDATSK